MTSVYTRKGDDGKTYTGSQMREFKHSINAVMTGTIDELHVQIGKCCTITNATNNEDNNILKLLAFKCLELGSIIYFVNNNKEQEAEKIIEKNFIDYAKTLEQIIDSKKLKKLENFLVFDNCNTLTITLHETRAKVRQTERVFTEWKESKNNLPQSIIHISQYLNRLSDFFFVLARYYPDNETIKPH